MITQLRGKLIEIYPTNAVIDCNGVGYWVNISLNTYSTLEHEELVTIFTHLIVREDAHILYGFATKLEREIFQKLISVNGVGPASGMMIISTLSSKEIATAIAQEDAKLLQSVKGIGAKTAQRIIIDLKDKLDQSLILDVNSTSVKNKSKNEALSALEVLGIPKKSAEKIMDKILQDQPDADVEFLVKETLKKI
ncbi:Holliday junction branch migration protein RuvA [Empedobacter falsenii]|uniref:Holliday junction branch migration complex subunit RuvA n=1 Tax=Empedobacter falsenii TaxID=343874 RepID=A0A376FX49_9FLAO|nr:MULTISPECIES: Holliday junction branch migration protein RuvA [Empedobacter]HAD78641.1 Holliday junction branch migration protein RuvA [Flavobacteriaceae bacterium]MDH1882945.1 Holliday junction branch migration protein RuvA [Empedobacter sp. GD03797]MDM1297356.1 Holliday junction branch migration protein RuvA [Empedobacter falsenii]MDM1317150.1 Holliday junction branch migration protein RuvA [Empedobacter falsenii]STD52905.1 Holliday junction ATP-dependent DNA helicase RuvA [Empedobacter f